MNLKIKTKDKSKERTAENEQGRHNKICGDLTQTGQTARSRLPASLRTVTASAGLPAKTYRERERERQGESERERERAS